MASGLPPSTSLWLAGAVVIGTLLSAAGVAAAARRLLQPAPKKARRAPLEVLNFGQSARLFVPAAAALLVGLFAGRLVDIGRDEAKEIAVEARLRAGLTP